MKTTNSTISERLVELIKSLKMNNSSFAKSLGKPPTTINYIANGNNKPSFEVLETIVQVYPQINRDWLMAGEGEMFKEQKQDKAENSDLMAFLKNLEEKFNQQLAIKDQQIAMKDQQINKFLDLLGKLEGVSLALISQVEPIFGFNLEKFGYTHALKVA